MDPDENIAEQRRIVRRIIDDGQITTHDTERLADLVESLDDWLSNGGFLPEDWQPS